MDRSLVLPDIIVLQEVEGPTVVHDLLYYHLSRKGGYRWYAVSKAEDSPIAVAIISRHPVSDSVVHAAPGCRPFLEATIETSRKEVVVFALHAKSRIGGGDEETEGQRIALSRALSMAAKRHEGGMLTLLCGGDFNENPDAVWDAGGGRQTALVDISHPRATNSFREDHSLLPVKRKRLDRPVGILRIWIHSMSSSHPPRQLLLDRSVASL